MKLFRTSLVGSYPQPDWLIDRQMLSKRMPPRIRAGELWRVPSAWLEQAQNDATIMAVHEQERAGLDIVTDGEIRRESYSNRFATALEGLDLDHPATITSRSGQSILVPRVVGPIRRGHSVLVEDVRFLRAHTERMVKVTVPGPFTMTQQAHNDYYADEAALALAYADVVNAEIHDLAAAGADVVQIDEPYLQPYPEKARAYGLAAINRALAGVSCQTALHTCFGYAALVSNRPEGYPFLAELSQCGVQQISIETAQCHLDCSILKSLAAKTIILGVIDLSTNDVESPETVAERIRRALPYVDPERTILAPDCGMKYLPRDIAFAKLQAMVKGAEIVRAEVDHVPVLGTLDRKHE
jgi:5-methyltetrahydropteroyltriglutamate--homocysteine methyltransferase